MQPRRKDYPGYLRDQSQTKMVGLMEQLKKLIKLTDDLSEDSSDFSKFDTISERLSELLENQKVRVGRIQKIFEQWQKAYPVFKKRTAPIDKEVQHVLTILKKEVLAELTE